MSKSKLGSYGDFTDLRDYVLDIYTESKPGTPYAYNQSNNYFNSSNFSSNNSQLNGVIGMSGMPGMPGMSGLSGLSGVLDLSGIQELNELREELNELRSGISILSKEYYFFQKGFSNRKIIKDYNYENINKCESVSGKVDKNFIEILQFLIAQFIKRNNPISIFNYSYVPDDALKANKEINILEPEPNQNFKLYFPTKILNLNLNEEEKIIQKTMEVAPKHMPEYPYYRIIVTTNVNNGSIRFPDISINKDVGIIEQHGGNREYYGTYRYIFVLSYFNA
jgi:hypothetical protein